MVGEYLQEEGHDDRHFAKETSQPTTRHQKHAEKRLRHGAAHIPASSAAASE